MYRPRMVAREDQEDLDDFDYDDEHVELESEIGEYRSEDEDEDMANDDMTDNAPPEPTSTPMQTPEAGGNGSTAADAAPEPAPAAPAPPKKPANKAVKKS